MAKTLRYKVDLITVRFKNVGRNSRTWEAQLPANDPAALIGEARKELISRGVDCYDGKVYAGMRHVGDYEIVEPDPILEPQKPKAAPKKKAAKKKTAKKKTAKKKVAKKKGKQ